MVLAGCAGLQAVEMHIDAVCPERRVDELQLLSAAAIHRFDGRLAQFHDLEHDVPSAQVLQYQVGVHLRSIGRALDGCHVVVGVNLTVRADLAVGADDEAVVEGLGAWSRSFVRECFLHA